MNMDHELCKFHETCQTHILNLIIIIKHIDINILIILIIVKIVYTVASNNNIDNTTTNNTLLNEVSY